jgi:hypothetical protein
MPHFSASPKCLTKDVDRVTWVMSLYVCACVGVVQMLMQKFTSSGDWRGATGLLDVIRTAGKSDQTFTNMAIEACAAAGT